MYEPSILILGCDKGNVYKYEKGPEKDAIWVKKKHIVCTNRAYDVLQVKETMILVCQDQGVFDLIDVTNMNKCSHNTVPEVEASTKTRLLMRGGQIACADINGLIFIQQKPA